MGILASSPELMNVVQQRQQPVQMAQGGAIDLNTVMGQLKVLKDSGDAVSLRRIASDPNYPDVVKRAASNLADSLRPDSVPLIQVGDVNLGNALSDATNRNPIGQSAGGQERSAAITPVGNVGDVNLSNALSDFSGRKPIGQSAGGQERSAKLRALPERIAGGIGNYLKEGFSTSGNVLPDSSGAMKSLTSPSVMSVRGSGDQFPLNTDQLKRSFMYPGEVLGFGVPDDAPGKANPIGQGIRNFFFGTEDSQSPIQSALRSADDAIVRGTSAAGNAIQDLEAGIISGFIPKPTDAALAKAQAEAGSIRESFPGRAAGTPLDTEGGVAEGLPLEIAKTPAEVLAEAKATVTTTPTQDGAAADAKKETDNKPSASRAKTDSAIASIQDIFSKAKQGLQGDKKVPSNQANNPEVADAFAVEYSQFADPDEVDLNKIQDAIDATFGDKKDFTESKKDAFWMGLMQAGLAMAAGESDNAMTNIAKGLSFGLTQYGKDIGELTEQQREDEKERRLFKTQMIRDERSANIAKAANKNQWTAAQNQMKQADASEKRTQAWKEKKLGIDNAFAMANLETNVIKSIADLELRQRTLDETTRSNLETESIARLKETPETLKLAREFGWFDEKNNVTDKGRAEAGETLKQVIMDAELLKARGKTVTPTDQDKVTSSLQRLIAGTGDEEDRARVLASSAGQAAIKDAGGDINEALKTMFAKMNPKFAVGQVLQQGGKKFRILALDEKGQPASTEEVK
jgi:hypothetical protein